MPSGNIPHPMGSNAGTNVSGKSTKHPSMRMTWKRALKLEAIARLSADPAGYSVEQIANILGCSTQTVILIRQLPEYHAKMIEIASGVVSAYDRNLRSSVENMREELRSMVPSSMMVIRNALHGRYGAQIQYRAATDVLDREGTNAKVSKSSVSHEVQVPLGVDPTIAANLMALLASAPTHGGADPVGGTDGFTRTAQDAGIQQDAMRASADPQALLDQLDTMSKKPN